MGVQERRLREREELRQEILDAARDLFVNEGYDAVSMRRIAEKIEYSPTTIYLHFKDKEEIFDCLCEETFARLDTKLDSAQLDDSIEGLKKGLRAYVDFGLKYPNHYQITFLTPKVHASASSTCRRKEAGCRSFECLRECVAGLVAKGEIADPDANKVAQALWCGAHGVTSLLIVHPDFPWVARNELIEQVINTMVDSLKRS